MASAKSLLSGLTDKGGRATTVLERIGLSPTILKEEHFPVRKSGELALAISEQLEDETLGFLRRRTPPGSIEMSLYALTSAANLREALDRLTHYWPLINSEIDISTRRVNDSIAIVGGLYDSQSPVAFAYASWSTLFLYRLMCWLIDDTLPLEKIEFSFDRPEDGDGYGDMFATQVEFSCGESALYFNTRYLSTAVNRDGRDVIRFMSSISELMTLKNFDETLSNRILRHIKLSPNPSTVTFERTAEKLNLSVDALRRRLAKEGTTFQSLKDSARREIAIYELQKPFSNVGEIAHMLGFSEPSAFSRAFKQWTGMSPASYRSNTSQKA